MCHTCGMGHTRGASAPGSLGAHGARDRRIATTVAVAALGLSNVATNRLLPDTAYVPWNLALAAGLLGLARRAGVDRRTLGTSADHVGVAAVTGGAGAVAIAAGYGLAVRTAGAVLQDRRATDLSPARARYEALVRIPLGTVVAEEVAFRGVLPALLAVPGRPDGVPDTLAALLFGLWHVLPSRDLVAANAGANEVAGRLGPTGTAATAVASTALAGVGLSALRRRTGHLLAPMIVHWAANALGLVAARTAARR